MTTGTAPRDYSAHSTFAYLDKTLRTHQPNDRYEPSALEENRGSLSWGAAVVCRSYLQMFQKFGDEIYLRKSVGHIEQMILSRDSLTGAADYRGNQSNSWRSGRPYSTNRVDFIDDAGRAYLAIRAKSADRMNLEHSGGGSNLFNLTFRDSDTGTEFKVNDLSLDPHDPSSITQRLANIPWKKPLAAARVNITETTPGLPPEGEYSMREQFYVAAVQTGQICTALLEFSELVMSSYRLRTYLPFARKYVSIAAAALREHDREFRLDKGCGYYVIESDAPYDTEGTDAPLNHSMSMARCYIQLAALTGQSQYEERAGQLITTLLNCLQRSPTADDAGGQDSWVWPYFLRFGRNYNGYGDSDQISEWRPRRQPNTRMDDVSHAIISVETAIKAHQYGAILSSTDLRRFANTYLQAVAAHDGEKATMNNYVDGSAGAGKYDFMAGRWACLTPWDDRIAHHSRMVMNGVQPEAKAPTTLLASATLVRHLQVV